MRKRFIFILALILAIFTFGCSFTTAFAMVDNETTDYSGYDVFETFCTEFKDRTPCTSQELDSAYYIMQTLQEYGYVDVNGTSSPAKVSDNPYLQSFSQAYSVYDTSAQEYKTQMITSYNVVAYKRSGKSDAKLLVIGCAYGNAYSLTSDGVTALKSEGAYETSSAVATALSIAKELKRSVELDFDVAFAFFGADLYDCMGANQFVAQSKQDLLGYVNLSAIGGGDYLYVYCDDVTTAHGKFFDGIVERFGYDVKGAPFDKKVYRVESDGDSRPYNHIGLSWSNAVFMDKGVPSVNIFGYNWDKGEESTLHANIMRTSDDTFEYMQKYYGKDKINQRILTAKNLVVNAILRNGELAEAFEKYDNGYSKLYSNKAYYGVLISCVVLAIVLFAVGAVFASKKTAKAGTPDFSTNSTFLNGENNVDNDDDIFGMKDDAVIGDSRDIDTDDNKTSDSDDDSTDDDDDIFGEF